MDRSRPGLTISLWILIASAGCTGRADDLGGPIPVASELAVDINVDAFPDILWHNGTSGVSQAWSMNLDGTRRATQTFDESMLDIPDSSGWVPVGILDADNQSEGRNSVLWHNGVTGQLQEWEMNRDGTRKSYVTNMDPSLDLPDSSGWRLVATGTFKHEGFPFYLDLVWHNGTTGATQVWFMGASLTRTGFADLDPSLNRNDSSGWRIAGADDFDGDGYADLVWHNGPTGQTEIWHMRGASATSTGVTLISVDTLTLNVSDSMGWSLVAVSNMDTDTSPDLLWHNGSTGQTQIWYMTGAGRKSFATLSDDLDNPDSSGWRIVRP